VSTVNARLRGAIVLFLTQHPVRSLGQMAGDSNGGAAVPLVWIEPVIEQADMLIAMRLQPNGAVGRLDKSPLKIVVDVAAGASMTDMASAGNDAGHEPCIAGQVARS
jgi:hypothetical protein